MEIPQKLIEKLARSKTITVLTGAGVSKESGIPTFREAQTGLWKRYNPEELATPQAFLRDPQLVWEWYEWRRSLISQAKPNPGHIALVEFSRQYPTFTLVTQNVDGLHQQAGSREVIELHGNIMRNKCFDEGVVVDSWVEDGSVPPKCPNCQSMLRPDVVWYGEGLPSTVVESAFEASLEAEVFLSVGTSSLVQPAAALPLYARQNGAVVVEVNPDQTPLTHLADYVIPHPSGEALPELVRRVWG